MFGVVVANVKAELACGTINSPLLRDLRGALMLKEFMKQDRG
jgi:hypothetical protein